MIDNVGKLDSNYLSQCWNIMGLCPQDNSVSKIKGWNQLCFLVRFVSKKVRQKKQKKQKEFVIFKILIWASVFVFFWGPLGDKKLPCQI